MQTRTAIDNNLRIRSANFGTGRCCTKTPNLSHFLRLRKSLISVASLKPDLKNWCMRTSKLFFHCSGVVDAGSDPRTPQYFTFIPILLGCRVRCILAKKMEKSRPIKVDIKPKVGAELKETGSICHIKEGQKSSQILN